MTIVAPRRWQAAFLAEHARATRADYLLVATPGAGKTLAACQAAQAARCEQIVVVCPTTALRSQWAPPVGAVAARTSKRSTRRCSRAG